MLKKLVIIPIIILFCFNCILITNATDDTSTKITYSEVVDNLENEIGKESTLEMLNRIRNEITELKDSSFEDLSNIIDIISTEYGVLFTDEQKEVLIESFQEVVENDSTGLWDAFLNLIDRFWEWIKSLHNESSVEVKPIEGEQQDVIEAGDGSVTINIPTVEQVDGIVNSIIEKVKEYIVVENTQPTD